MPPTELEPVALPATSAASAGRVMVEWRRSRRARRVSLRIDAARGHVVVTLPWRGQRAAGLHLLTTHAGWVRDRLAALPQAIALQDGAQVPLAGQLHLIRHVPTGRGGAWLEDNAILVAGAPEFLPRRVRDFLRQEARRRLGALVAQVAAAGGLTPRRVTIKDTRTRWGSCTQDGVLMFSWRLVMAPVFVQHYVVAHEVAHLRHLNHGPRFWALVDVLCPGRQRAMAWLSHEGAGLLRVG